MISTADKETLIGKWKPTGLLNGSRTIDNKDLQYELCRLLDAALQKTCIEVITPEENVETTELILQIIVFLFNQKFPIKIDLLFRELYQTKQKLQELRIKNVGKILIVSEIEYIEFFKNYYVKKHIVKKRLNGLYN